MSRVRCRACGVTRLEPVLSLGPTPLANALLRPEDAERPEQRRPLDLVVCPVCWLVQITETVPPEELFRDYPYFSSFAETMLEHARAIAERLRTERHLGAESLVVEVASNDGYLLQYYRQAGIPVLGIEPARNVARVAVEERGVRTITEFFGRRLAAELVAKGSRADVVHANNVLAHVPDLNGFVAGLQLVLKDDGEAVIEVPYVRDLIDKTEFDTIYHEHLCYFSLSTLHHLFARHGLVIRDAERLAIHGGSLRVFVAKARACAPTPAVAALLDEEAAAGMTGVAYYRAFAGRVAEAGRALCHCLARLKGEGARVAAYGASAKSTTLLTHLGIGSETIEYFVDRSPAKQGRLTPGTRLHIYPPERLLSDMPDYVLLLAWNFADEVLAQQAEYRRRGGRFVIPLPWLRIE